MPYEYQTFFTADPHHYHSMLVAKGHRPRWTTVEAMTEELIERWNSVVGIRDTVHLLGDFSLGGVKASVIRDRLNGAIHLTVGNHDSRATKEPHLWESVSDLRHIKVEGQRITLCHYPMISWYKSHLGAWMLHGHSHNSLATSLFPDALRLDVGVDVPEWDFAPVSMGQLRSAMARHRFVPVDHHTASTT